ncbi:MAG: hypothetical protein Q8T08_03670 [Ignavibacteria bacterium]|nr:hypothetical protein [Ignavibacteria bacterium]
MTEINYDDKHYKSKWKKMFQSYRFPKRFGYDKRKAHLSSMIMLGEMKRDELGEWFLPLP